MFKSSSEAVTVGALGGKARAKALTREQRKAIAKKAAKAKWAAFYAARRARLGAAR